MTVFQARSLVLVLLMTLGCMAACSAAGDTDGSSGSGNSSGVAAGGAGAGGGVPVDDDKDGFTDDVDCDDENPDVNPNADEVCDGIDNDCDGEIDVDASDAQTWYEDKDGDGYGISGVTVEECEQPEGYASEFGDCNDDDADFYPDAPETDCSDPNDYNCDGSVMYQDADNDGFAACVECDDSNPDVYPGAAELCDGLDNDCNGLADADVDGEVDVDNDGVLSCEDCDDNDEDNYPGNTEACDGQDNDCNGVADAAGGEFDNDSDGVLSCLDCDDNDPANFPGNMELCDGQDNDCNGLGDAPGGEVDADNDGVLACQDCDDTNPNNFPGNGEACDGQDNDCNGLADADPAGEVDADNDGVLSCNDCADNDPNRFPGNTESCDGVDNDCNGLADAPGGEVDADSDGSLSCDDCNDNDPNAFPGNPEVCDGIDNDCNGLADFPGGEADADNDGVLACSDCNDNDPNNYPGNTEVCDGQDNDCNGLDDFGSPGVGGVETDNDGDGQSECAGDCDDTDPANYTGNTEVCDGQDNNCNGLDDAGNPGVGGWETDNDGDGQSECAGDCNDANPANFSGNMELCDGQDNDCNGLDDAGNPGVGGQETDNDGDGQAECAGDCNDADPANFTGNPEVCDGQDNDCNGLDDAGNPGVGGQETDNDGDGQAECAGDCNDADPANFSGNTETCDGQDNDCNGLDDAGNPGVGGQETDDDGDGQAECAGDCNDADPANFTGNAEVCDGQDNDCNGLDDAGNPGVGGQETDNDGDGQAECAGDCNDADPANFTGNAEVCDGQDNDCNGLDDAGNPGVGGQETDNDGDGQAECAGDCNDADPANFSGNAEVCDGQDNDCNGLDDAGTPGVGGWETDNDGDGQAECAGDCNDADPANYTGNTEVCDGQDNDCNGLDDAGNPGVGGQEADNDGDGQAECAGDCDDSDPANFSGNAEVCDGQDNNCNGLDDAGNPGVGGQETDNDGDGQAECAGDCDDTNPANYTGNTELCDGQDNDCNGLDDAGNPGVGGWETDNDGDGQAECAGDCNDANPANFTGNTEVCDGQDNDCNGLDDFGNPGVGGVETDNDGDGQAECAGDCDDSDPANYSGNTEICDGQDNDCNGLDDFGNPGVGGVETDNDGDGQAECAGDCDDSDPANYSGNTEVCDGQDNDCNGLDDAGNPGVGGQEADNDGDGQAECAGDCDDTDPSNYTGNPEVCDGQDNDCNGLDDFGNPGVNGWETDNDGDGQSECAGDCNDADPANFSGNPEVCDGQDNDCNGLDDAGNPGVGGWESDSDGDGQSECAGDCNDANPANYSGNAEVCDGQDNDCNGLDDAGNPGVGGQETDNDGDGQAECAGDCNDANPFNFSGNPEVCDGQDNNCNGLADAPGGEVDSDGDGSLSCADCNDGDPNNYPGNTEACDGQDNNCNGLADAPGGEVDGDSDGVLSCADCNDGDPNNYPGNTEACDGQDNDCDSFIDEDPPIVMCGDVPNAIEGCAGSCYIASCSSTYYDVDMTFGTGCECQAEPLPETSGQTCAAAIDLNVANGGNFLDSSGSSYTVTGNGAPAGRDVWYVFTAQDDNQAIETGGDEFHAAVEFLSNPGNAYRIDIYENGCPGMESALWSNEADLFEWYTNFNKTTSGCTLGGTCGEGNCSAGNVDNVNNCNNDTRTFYVRVRRPDLTLSCDQYSLRFSNGICPTSGSTSPACP